MPNKPDNMEQEKQLIQSAEELYRMGLKREQKKQWREEAKSVIQKEFPDIPFQSSYYWKLSDLYIAGRKASSAEVGEVAGKAWDAASEYYAYDKEEAIYGSCIGEKPIGKEDYLNSLNGPLPEQKGSSVEVGVSFPTRFKAKNESGEWVEGSFIVRTGRNGYHYFILELSKDLEEEDNEHYIDPSTLMPAENQYGDYLNMGD